MEVERPERSLKPAGVIAKYWAEKRDTFPNVDAKNRKCFGCGLKVPSWRSLDRAHLVDRMHDGLDVEPNIAMLCIYCHNVMPSFKAGEGQAAIDWVLNEWKPRHLAHRYLMSSTDQYGAYSPDEIDAAMQGRKLASR